jgi:hypothetical protein
LWQLGGQLFRHRLLTFQHPSDVRSAYAKQVGKLIPPTNLLLKPPQLSKRLVQRCCKRIGLLAQSLSSPKQLHQGRIGDPLPIAEAGKRVMGISPL